MPHRPDDLLRAAGGASLSVALLLTLAGCATRQAPSSPTEARSDAQSSSPSQPFGGLLALADRQRVEPDTKAAAAPPPPGVDESLLHAFPTEATDASRLALADAIVRVGGGEAAAPPAAQSAPANDRAIKLYVAGRAKLLDGKAADAIPDLEAAARLDPGSSTLWRELAEAQIQLGRRAAATQSYQRAVALGLREPRALGVLGREALRARRFEEAVRLLAQAREAKDLGPIGQLAVVDADLAEALRELGYASAAIEAYKEGLSIAISPVAQARYFADLAELFRRRAELWMRAGDLSFRLGDLDGAAEAYEHASGYAGADASALLARRVLCDLRRGRSAQAALTILGQLAEPGSRPDDRAVALIAFLGEHTELEGRLAEAIDEIIRRAGPGLPATALARLTQAAAAALPPEPARRALRAYLAAHPSDPIITADLFSRCDGPGAIAEEAANLAHGSPLAGGLYADALIAMGVELDECVRHLAASRRPEAVLIHGVVLIKLGRPEPALERLVPPEGPTPIRAGILAARSGAAADSARFDEVQRCITELRGMVEQSDSVDARRALAAACLAAQNPGDAFEAVAPLVSAAASPSVDLLLQCADLLAQLGRGAEAKALLDRASRLDPTDERVYESLFTLLAPSGPLADERELSNVARRLRQNVPDSRFARTLAAQEQATRSLWPQAESTLLGLMDANSEDPRALALLVAVWERAAKASPEITAKGEAWLRARLVRRGQSPQLCMALARVMNAQDRPADAEKILAERLEAWPMPEMARLREWIVREGLEKPDEADRLALARLEAAPRTPDHSIELAELLMRQGKIEPAASALERGLPAGMPLAGTQARRLVALLAGLKPEKFTDRSGPDARSSLRLFDLLVDRGVPLSPQLHVTRLALLAASAPLETSRLIDAINALGSKFEELRMPAAIQVAGALAGLDDPTGVLRFLPAAAALTTPPSEDLLFEWFRLTVLRGSSEDVERLVRDSRPEVMLRVIQTRMQPDLEIPDDAESQAAELAYVTAMSLSSEGFQERAVAAYRLALRLKPDHGWACNNLGYLILERGGDLGESERLIEIAYEQHKDEYNIVDSLAWVRYLRGHVEDRTEPDGTVREGAVTLLRRAADELGGKSNPTINLHLGDALWRSKKPAEAVVCWREAEGVLRDTISLAVQELAARGQQAGEEPAQLRELRRELAEVRARLDATEANREPPIAPLRTEQPSP